ncbi:DUF1669 domain-containing protein [Helicobacter muridarum]|nr:DUF1669 domain-containing protein [Helicobacter muridarum]
MRIIFSLFAFLLIATYANANNNKERFYIMPYEQQEAIKDLTNSIMQAKTKIDIAIYSFTNREIAKALREASNKGVKINIIYDSGQKKAENSTIGYLEKFDNIHTCLLEGKTARNGKYNGIMHQKMIIIDDNLIGLGSANWSKNAFENNYETLYFTYSTDTVKKASHYFKDMLKQCKPFI